MTKPLPRIGVDRLFYALITQDDASAIVYGSTVQMQGVSQVGYNPNTQLAVYYADDGAYESVSQDGEADISINVADIDPAIYAEIMGVTQSASNGVISEGKEDSAPLLAIGYRTQKSNGEYRYIWVLKGRFGKPQLVAQTKGATINMQEREIMFKGLNRDYDGKKRRKVDSDDVLLPVGVTNTILNDSATGWFSDPDFAPIAPGTPLSDVAAVTGVGVSGSIDLTFTAPTGATAVKAQIYDAAFGVWYDATTAAAITAVSTTAIITGLTASNTYTVRLVVTGGASNGISNTDSAAAKA